MRFLTAAALVLALSGAARALEIPLTVEEPVGAARSAEVASGGIPLPEGKYKDPAAFSLAGGVPVQVSPIVKYPDGSLHWVLVSFPVRMGANEKKTFTLRDAAGAATPENPVVVKEDGNKVTVSNGLVSFTLDRASFNGFESVAYQGKKVFQAAEAALVANGKGGPGKLTHFEYRYRGPVRTTLYLKGTYGGEKAPTWAMAVTLNAGESAIHIDHNLRNAAVGAKKMTVGSPQICLGLAGKLAAGQSAVAPPSGRRGAPAFGWQSFTGDADVLVFLRHGGPGNKGVYKVEAAGGKLAIHLSPAEGDVSLADGAHKATEIDLVFGKSASPEALSEPLHARAPAAWYAEHDGFGVGLGWGSLEDEKKTYENAGWKNLDDPKKLPREKTDPNLYVGWFDSHGTSECDHLQGMVFGYVRTGQRGYLDQCHAWARYWRTFLLWRSDEWSYGKDGRYRTPKWGGGRCCTEGCHFYGVGIFNYALLTGDVDALEAAYDWAEMANVAWYGQYTNKKPGDDFSAYGSRGFARSYLAIARAYDVARTAEWEKALLHYVQMAVRTPARDPRGFTIGWSSSNAAAAHKTAEKRGPAALEVLQKEGVKRGGNKDRSCVHPKYGEYRPKCVGTWPEAMESMANYMAYEALSRSKNPVAQLAAEDAMDYCIAEAYLGVKYAFHPVQKCVFYYMYIDYPIPDFVPQWCGGEWDKGPVKRGSDSWYTKWWPNTIAYGYKLTGEKIFREKTPELLWWGLNRDFVGPPRWPEGDAPTYARVEHNTKGDWMTPTAFAFGVMARPKKDEAAPAAIKDLAARALGGGKVELTWTAPADQGGKTSRYQVKWGHKPLVGYLEPGDEYRKHFKNGELDVTYWNMAKNVLGEPEPDAAGKAQKMTVEAERGKCFFAIRTFDDAHNRSALSNVVAVEVN